MVGKQVVHPARETLAAFGSGKLDPAVAVAVEEHIAECEECCETLHGLGSDTFLDLLRESDDVQLDSIDDGTISSPPSHIETLTDLPSELNNHPRYRVRELLGKGGMGNVFKAEHTLMNRSVALKFINPDLIQNAQAVERFRREVRSAAQLAHPNIVAAYDAEQAGDMHLLVMEYVPGDNLSDVIKRDGPLDISLACDFIRQAAQGLQHAHNKGMVHRDIKPHNLMVTSDGQIKILDFGLATLAVETTSSDDNSQTSHASTVHRISPNLTSAGSMMGTPDFISPEQSRDARSADIRSDIYSLGCTFYYLLTGRPPFTEGSALERVKAHEDVEPEAIENVRVDIPEEVTDVVRRMMAKDPTERFQTPAEIADALAPFADAHRTTPAPDRVHDGANAGNRSWWPPTIVQSVALAAFAFVLGGIIYITTDNGTLEVNAVDDSVEVIIRSANSAKQGQKSISEMRIVDTVTGTSAKRLPSGEYVLSLKGDKNDFELDKDRLVLKRGSRIVVTVTRKKDEPSAGRGLRIRQIWNDPKDVSGSPSPNGRYLSFTDWETGDLAIHDLETGTNRRITMTASFALQHFAEGGSAWSPDRERIAYAWKDGGHYDLRVVRVDGSEPPRTIVNQVPYIQPYEWSADGKSLLVFLRTKSGDLALISVEDKKVRSLNADSGMPIHASISPDGRYVVFDRQRHGDAKQHTLGNEYDIVIRNVEEDSESLLVSYPGYDFAPVWNPDGTGIVFTSDRSGSTSLWALQVEDGEPSGSAYPLGIDMNRMAPMGFTEDGSFVYHENTFGRADIFVAVLEPSSRKQPSAPQRITSGGLNARPTWAPGGDMMSYVSQRGPLREKELVIRSMKTGHETTLRTAINWHNLPVWSRDDRYLLMSGHHGQLGWGLYVVRVQTGEFETIRSFPSRRQTPLDTVWSVDEESVFYVRRAQPGVFACDRRTGEEKNLIPNFKEPIARFSLAISADDRLAFATESAVYVMPSTFDAPQAVLPIAEEEIVRGIAWANNGLSLICAIGQKDAHHQLWQIDLADRKRRDLGITVSSTGHISMHPDGKQIAFTSPHAEDSTTRGVWALENLAQLLRNRRTEARNAFVPDRR